MSKRGVEQALGKLVMDAEFRDAFFRNPAGTILATGIELTEPERGALGRIRPGALAAFQRYLEGKRLASIEDVHRS